MHARVHSDFLEFVFNDVLSMFLITCYKEKLIIVILMLFSDVAG